MKYYDYYFNSYLNSKQQISILKTLLNRKSDFSICDYYNTDLFVSDKYPFSILTADEYRHFFPLHPYTVELLLLILKYISPDHVFSFFTNPEYFKKQFDNLYEKNALIDNSSFQLITVDMLWDYIVSLPLKRYKNEERQNTFKEEIIRRYNGIISNNITLNSNELKVIKVTLILEFFSKSITNLEELIANDINLVLMLETSSFNKQEIKSTVHSLISKSILINNRTNRKTPFFEVVDYNFHLKRLEIKKDLLEKSPIRTIVSKLNENISVFTGYNSLKYALSFNTIDSIKHTLKEIEESTSNNIYHFIYCIPVSKDDYNTFSRLLDVIHISELSILDINYSKVIFVLPKNYDINIFNDYYDLMSYSLLYESENQSKCSSYREKAQNLIDSWINSILYMECSVYGSISNLTKEYITLRDLNEYIKAQELIYNKTVFFNIYCTLCKECSNYRNLHHLNHLTNFDELETKKNIITGIKCESIYGLAESSLSKFIEKAKSNKLYWQEMSEYVLSTTKEKLEEFIMQSFKSEEVRISIEEIILFLQNDEYGFYSCNLSAFCIGFLLKEYSDGRVYGYNYKSTFTSMSPSILSDIIFTGLSGTQTNSKHYIFPIG